MRKLFTTLGFILLWVVPFCCQRAAAQQMVPAAKPVLQLKTGDRVVFLGNSLLENDLPYGYLELALTTRWPDQQVTFRNIAWTGDTVWGEARSYISSPSAYDLLFEQLTKAQPTVVVIAYGAIEAQQGELGLSRFKEGLHQLLDKVAQLGAQAILLSPIPVMAAAGPGEPALQNSQLELYAAAMAQTATARHLTYLDVYHRLLTLGKQVKLSDNGLHLNQTGYYYLAATLEEKLGLLSRQPAVTIQVTKKTAEATAPVTLRAANHLTFTLNPGYLPLPLPDQATVTPANGQVIKITGLKKGFYTLTSNNAPVITASAAQWQAGVTIRHGAAYSQAAQLRDLIVKKNQLFFQQYRPQNRTYILGFRAHEQGRHAQGLAELDIIITWLEGQIAQNQIPQPVVYQLTPVK